MSSDIEERVRKAAVLNAVRHDGKADPKAVLGNLLGDHPDLRSKARELVPLVRKVVDETKNMLTLVTDQEKTVKLIKSEVTIKIGDFEIDGEKLQKKPEERIKSKP